MDCLVCQAPATHGLPWRHPSEPLPGMVALGFCDQHAHVTRSLFMVVGGPFDGQELRIEEGMLMLSLLSGVPIELTCHDPDGTDYLYEVLISTNEVACRGQVLTPAELT